MFKFQHENYYVFFIKLLLFLFFPSFFITVSYYVESGRSARATEYKTDSPHRFAAVYCNFAQSYKCILFG